MYKVLIFLICLFLVAFPKGGVKIGDTPITFGYVLLLLYTLFSVLLIQFQDGKLYLKRGRRYALMCCLPFQIYSAFILLLSQNTVSFGYLLSFVLSIILMPFIFLFFLNKYIDLNRFEDFFSPVFKNCIRFVSIFGVILFVLRLKTGKDFEIPFLTVNLDDAGTIGTKFNMRAGVSKLVSTYNNGNIYGVSLLILLPLYFEKERLLIFKLILILSLILTLSRTVWAGLTMYLIIYFASKINSVKGWISIAAAIVFIIIGGPIILGIMNVNLDFLFDKNLGGRVNTLNVFGNFTFFGSLVFKGVSEIVYTSIIDTFGIFGLVLFLLYLFSPVIVYFFILKQQTFNKSTAFWGLFLYWFLCLSDGAMLLIPVMAFYWFISSYIFRQE